MTSPIDIRFYVLDGDGHRISENELRAHIDRYRDIMHKDGEYEGVLEISVPNAPVVVMEDALPALVKNLCFLAIPELVADKRFVYHYYSHYGQLHISPEGDFMRITGDESPPLCVERVSFLQGLYDCGLRFIRLLDQAQGTTPDPDVVSLMEFLDQHRAVAQLALINSLSA